MQAQRTGITKPLLIVLISKLYRTLTMCQTRFQALCVYDTFFFPERQARFKQKQFYCKSVRQKAQEKNSSLQTAERGIRTKCPLYYPIEFSQ